jgi:hypothetical protein
MQLRSVTCDGWLATWGLVVIRVWAFFLYRGRRGFLWLFPFSPAANVPQKLVLCITNWWLTDDSGAKDLGDRAYMVRWCRTRSSCVVGISFYSQFKTFCAWVLHLALITFMQQFTTCKVKLMGTRCNCKASKTLLLMLSLWRDYSFESSWCLTVSSSTCKEVAAKNCNCKGLVL